MHRDGCAINLFALIHQKNFKNIQKVDLTEWCCVNYSLNTGYYYNEY